MKEFYIWMLQKKCEILMTIVGFCAGMVGGITAVAYVGVKSPNGLKIGRKGVEAAAGECFTVDRKKPTTTKKPTK